MTVACEMSSGREEVCSRVVPRLVATQWLAKCMLTEEVVGSNPTPSIPVPCLDRLGPPAPNGMWPGCTGGVEFSG
jgi:hypothetical protein